MDFAAAKAKQRYDNTHRFMEFNPGDKVFLRLHHGYYLPGKPPKSYSQQRSGPWTVLERVGRLAYRLDLPETSKVHPVVSIAHLSPSAEGGDPFHRKMPPPGPVEADQDTDNPGNIFETEVVLKHRKGRRGRTEYLVKWKGYGHEHNS